jgi:beta-glucosidase
VQAFRASGAPGQIGITLNLQPTYPLADTEADRRAAGLSQGYTDRWYLDPLFGRGYPIDVAARYVEHGYPLAFDSPADQTVIAEPMDFLGINYYSRRVVSAGGDEFGWTVRQGPSPGAETTGLDWEVVPGAMADVFATLRRDYPPIPLYVTENGAAYEDAPGADGRVDDAPRIDFLRRHIAVVEEAIEAGSDVRGYFAWSFIDNFEWALGYAPRFGLLHVDYTTQRRTPKASFEWYRGLVARNGG